MATPYPEPLPDQPDVCSIPAPFVRALRLVGWDGALPLCVALGPVLVKTIWPKPPGAVGLVLVLAPPIAALIRAHIGWHQIANRCAGRAPWLRQIAMAAAIILLLAFEAAVGVLTFADDIPDSAWWFPTGIYAVYLLMITLALRSPREKSYHSCSTDTMLEA